MHAGGVQPDEEGLLALDRLVNESLGGRVDFLVNGLHALLRQRARVLALLAALADGVTVQHPARAILLFELRIFRVVIGLRFLLRIKVVKVAEELVEAVHRRQVFVLVAQVILAELAGSVALLLQEITDGRRPIGDTVRRAGHADGQQPRAEWMLTKDE